jgi:hypothetical protein
VFTDIKIVRELLMSNSLSIEKCRVLLGTLADGKPDGFVKSGRLKAALRIAKPDSRFLRAFEDVRDSDGRLKKGE